MSHQIKNMCIKWGDLGRQSSNQTVCIPPCGKRKTWPITFHPLHQLFQADSIQHHVACTCRQPPQTHTDAHTDARSRVRWLRGSQNQRYKARKLKDQQSGRPVLSRAGMLLIRRPPKWEPATRRCRWEWAFSFPSPLTRTELLYCVCMCFLIPYLV